MQILKYQGGKQNAKMEAKDWERGTALTQN